MDRPVVRPWPRAMNDETAGAYVMRSASWLRKIRYEDGERMARGEAPKGPAYIRQGTTIRYLIESLDEWLDKFKEEQPEGWSEREMNTSGLKRKTKGKGNDQDE